MNKKSDLDQIVMDVEEEIAEAAEGSEDQAIGPYNPGWSEYVLDHLDDSELRDGNPTVDGLRRVTEEVFGDIITSSSHIYNHDTSRGVCTIKHTLQIRKHSTGDIITVDGCVDVNRSNIPHPFNQHLVATADTRAEGKAIRRALKIRVVTAEEMQNSDEDDLLAAEENITDQQILAINQMCKRLDVNLEKAVKSSCAGAESVRAVSNLQGRMILSSLSEYQRNPSIIPEDVSGYDSNWRETFDTGGK
jgi:hypothetical protein|tara:strand:+ start:179 stop:919 length:741 start_codon:yes stop_codon:yes gene_type:complete